jgi:hypothetical protein
MIEGRRRLILMLVAQGVFGGTFDEIGDVRALLVPVVEMRRLAMR